VLDLLEWIGPSGSTYEETLSSWEASCPQLAVWEEANARDLVVRDAALVGVSPRGAELLHLRRR
jgi:hypothetical protein